jgi:thioredoxin 1
MLRRGAFLLVLMSAIGLGWAQEQWLSVGSQAPDFVLKDLQGKYVKLSRGYGRQETVIALSRLNSVPCRNMMQELEKLQQQYHGDRVAIYIVNLEGDKARPSALATVKQLGLTYPILTEDGDSLPPVFKVETVPHLLVVDQDGVIQFSRAGCDPELIAALKASVNENRPLKLPRLVDVEGVGCVACQKMPPILQELREQLAGKVRIDIGQFEPDVAEEYNLKVIPTQLFFNAEGKEVYRHEGTLTKDQILIQLRKMGVATD